MFKPLFRLGAPALLAAATAIALVQPVRAAEVPSISQTALKEAIKTKKVVVLDVNGTESWKSGHIPTALNYASVEGKLAKVLPKDKKSLVVAYCGNEHCGAYKKAAEAAMKLGYTNVKHFSPGIMGWKKSGAAIEKAPQKS